MLNCRFSVNNEHNNNKHNNINTLPHRDHTDQTSVVSGASAASSSQAASLPVPSPSPTKDQGRVSPRALDKSGKAAKAKPKARAKHQFQEDHKTAAARQKANREVAIAEKFLAQAELLITHARSKEQSTSVTATELDNLLKKSDQRMAMDVRCITHFLRLLLWHERLHRLHPLIISHARHQE